METNDAEFKMWQWKRNKKRKRKSKFNDPYEEKKINYVLREATI